MGNGTSGHSEAAESELKISDRKVEGADSPKPRRQLLLFKVFIGMAIVAILYTIGAVVGVKVFATTVGIVAAVIVGLLLVIIVVSWFAFSSTVKREQRSYRVRRAVAMVATLAFVAGFTRIGLSAKLVDVDKFDTLAAQLVVTVFPVSLALVFAVSQLNARYSTAMSDVVSDWYVLLYCLVSLIGLFFST